MANLMLSIDDDLLQKVREAATREQTSFNAVVREFLTRYVDTRARQFEALDACDALAKRNVSRSSGSWTRDSLHERRTTRRQCASSPAPTSGSTGWTGCNRTRPA